MYNCYPEAATLTFAPGPEPIFLELGSDRIWALSYILCNPKLMIFSTVIVITTTTQYAVHVVQVVVKYWTCGIKIKTIVR